jgi:hypothetical protein
MIPLHLSIWQLLPMDYTPSAPAPVDVYTRSRTVMPSAAEDLALGGGRVEGAIIP